MKEDIKELIAKYKEYLDVALENGWITQSMVYSEIINDLKNLIK